GEVATNIPIHNFARLLHQNPGARTAWLALKEKRQRYETLYAEPLEGDSFDDKLEEILRKQDQL
ncbi:MAG: hypothetical protein ACR2QR_03805, partial [Woeseiaceae bacterium]